MSTHFGQQRLVLVYCTSHDFYSVDVEGRLDGLSDYVIVSESFDVDIKELANSAEVVNLAKIAEVDEQLEKARSVVETLKDKRANLLALPGKVS